MIRPRGFKKSQWWSLRSDTRRAVLKALHALNDNLKVIEKASAQQTGSHINAALAQLGTVLTSEESQFVYANLREDE